jgi:hypothetical protein
MASYSLDAWTDINTALLARIGAGGSAALEFYSAADVLLASIDLDLVGASIDPTTADLAIPVDGREESAPAAGEASYTLVRNGAAAAVARLPCKVGTVADPGWCVMTTLSIVLGQPVEAAALVFAAGDLIEV